MFEPKMKKCWFWVWVILLLVMWSLAGEAGAQENQAVKEQVTEEQVSEEKVTEEEDFDLLSLSFEELMDIEVMVATKTSVSLRETPGIVSVITREEILDSGARDLLEVLTLFVPGITFSMDVEGAVGIGIRGLTGHEGKVLLLLDGQECNEEVFATTVFGNHYPVENIEKIEVIRGPGSAIYGGYAGVGVISITTRGAKENGLWVSGLYSQMKHTYSHRNMAVGFGHEGEDLSVSLSSILGQGMRSDRDMVDILGDSMSMKGNSELNPTNVNLNINYKGLDLRAIMDRYHATQIDLWDENYQDGALKEKWDSYFFNIKFDIEEVADQKLTITPEWKYKIQYPWNVTVPEVFTNEKRAEKMQFGLSSIWDINEKMNLVSGLEFYTNYMYMPDNPTEFEEYLKGGESRTGYKNFAGYAQLMMFHDVVNTTIGGRFDTSQTYGTSFVPRIGLTKAWDKLHAKAMYSRSFRIPGGNIPNSVPEGYPDIEPENGNNYEVEMGYQIKDNMMFTLNAFDVSFDKAIVYLQGTETGTGSYFNSGKYGSRGVEAQYRYQADKLSLLCNYAYYRVSRNDIEAYEVAGHDHSFLAFPQHRFNFLAGLKINDHFSIHPSASIFGKRYGYAFNSSEGEFGLNDFDPTLVFNLNFRIKDVFKEGMEIDFGVRDLFDSEYEYIQAYNSGHAPLPAPTRSIYARLSYRF